MKYSQYADKLNQQIESLDPSFITNFLRFYHEQPGYFLHVLNEESLVSQLSYEKIIADPGKYLLLLAKIYLYNTLPKSQITGMTWNMYQSQSKLLLAYFYLRVAAQKYENSEAYYYLALLDYYKITPHQTVIENLKQELKTISMDEGYDKQLILPYEELLNHLSNRRLISVQHNLFLGSLFEHQGAKLVLANLFREGVGIEKNCTTSLAYYLSVIKNSYVDSYQVVSTYPNSYNFEKQLYAKTKISFDRQQDVHVVQQSQFLDTETIIGVYQLAENYLIGRGGFKRNQEKAVELFSRLAAQDHKNSKAMLGICYFNGQGVPMDRKRARVLFEDSKKVAKSQAMLITMDFFEIQSKGKRDRAIQNMKGRFLFKFLEIYIKKKENMDLVLKYIFGSLIVKGDIKDIQVDDGVLLLATSAKEGHVMSKITMGLLFADGIDISFDCIRATEYFSDQSRFHPFFKDKLYVARLGLKDEHNAYSLIKYLQLTMIGDGNAFINALYLLEIYHQQSLGLNKNSWNIKIANENTLYKNLKKQRIVPDLYSFLLKQFNFVGKRLIKFQNLQTLSQGNDQIIKQYEEYVKQKLIIVSARTKSNSLMNFYQYKKSSNQDALLLTSIADSKINKLHVLESRYLLGQYYHQKSFETLVSGRDHTKQQFQAIQQYKKATNSSFLGKILFYIQEIKGNPFGIDYENNEMFQFGIVDDFLACTLLLSIIIFYLYYKRSIKLDQIHRKQFLKAHQQQRLKHDQQSANKKSDQIPKSSTQQHQSFESASKSDQQNFQKPIQQKLQQKVEQSFSQDNSQPQIIQSRPSSQGIRIGGSEFSSDYSKFEIYRQEESNKQ